MTELKVGVTTASGEETENVARQFSKLVPENTVLALHGDLGAGKTTFIRGLARAWGIEESITSPTFNLYTIHNGHRQLIHMDAYRLDDRADFETLMIDDFLESPWCLAIEWPERIADSIPDDAWHLYLTIDASSQHTIKLAI